MAGAHSAELFLELYAGIFAFHTGETECCFCLRRARFLVSIVYYFERLSFLRVYNGYPTVKIDFYGLILRDLSVSIDLAAFNFIYAMTTTVLVECII